MNCVTVISGRRSTRYFSSASEALGWCIETSRALKTIINLTGPDDLRIYAMSGNVSVYSPAVPRTGNITHQLI